VPRLEIDVRFLSDDAMLIFHDSELAAETTGSGRAEVLDRQGARRIRYREDEDHAVCFLEDVVEAMRGSGTLLQVDLKLMRPMSAGRLQLLCAALEPVRDQVLIGSQAHWNVWRLAANGFRVAFDPTLQMHYLPGRDPSLFPARVGVHGLWDDSPLAHIRHASAREYLEARIEDLIGLVPTAVEWMVDERTLRYIASLGVSFGKTIADRGIELAAWTLHDEGAETTRPLLEELLNLGAATIIADDAPAIAAYAASLPAAAFVNRL